MLLLHATVRDTGDVGATLTLSCLDRYHFALLECSEEDRHMVKISPSLGFPGTCGDAFRRYASLFGGDIVYMLTYAESPLAESVPPDWRDKVWFARLRAGGLEITGGDPMFPDYEAPRGFSMVIGVAHADEAERLFAGLADGGEVLMPLQATHWSPRYGVVRDPFGIRWEINCDPEPAG